MLSYREKSIWLADMIDGEGFISIFADNGGSTFHPHTAIVNTNKKIVDTALEYAEVGSVVQNRSANSLHKALYLWRARGSDCEIFIQRIFEFLTIKQEQAVYVLELCKRINGKVGRSGIRNNISEEERWTRWEMYNECKFLNMRGT